MQIIAGLGPKLSERVTEHFGGVEKMRSALRADPYKLLDIDGISFRRADQVAKLGFGIKSDDDPRRQKALIRKVLRDHTSFGHTYLPKNLLAKYASKENIHDVDTRLDAMESTGEIVVERGQTHVDWVYDRKLWVAETGAVSYTFGLNQPAHRQHHFDFDYTDYPGGPPSWMPFVPDKDQHKFLHGFASHQLSVLTGGPGTGKTFIIQSIFRKAREAKLAVALAAPTGKAAKRLSEATGGRATTIHRLLRAGWGHWGHSKNNKLKLDLLVIDESSMIDIELAWRLLQAVPAQCQVVFVGDADQLPPVGPGAFFRDLIKSRLVPIFYLRTNHRQGPGSVIAANAIAINQGSIKLEGDSDFAFIQAEHPINIRSKLLKIIKGMLADFPDPYRQIQVLTPQHGTLVGVKALNEMLRFELNPLAKAKQRFSVGDKVMQTYNDYDLGIFNGFVGRIEGIQGSNLLVNFHDHHEEIVRYPMPAAYQGGLMHAFAATVHKFQGSECDAGIFIVSSSHNWMLTRNLLYTAITRFKKRCVVLGDAPAFKRSIVNTKEKMRYSRFVERLMEVSRKK